MSVSEFDSDQKDRHRQQKQEFYQNQRHHEQSQRLDNQICTDHKTNNQCFHAELNGRGLHSQVNFNRCSQVFQEVTFDRHDSHAEDQAASASPEKSTRLVEAFSAPPELSQRTNLVIVTPLGELSSYRKSSGSPNRVCRICSKKFSSGRALGGHMRMHGPLFTQGSGNKIRAANGMQKQDHDNEGYVDEDEETASIVNAFEDESDKELARDVRSEQASLSSGGSGDAKFSCKIDGYGDDAISTYAQEREFPSFTCNAEIAGDGAAVGSTNSTDVKSLLYTLRHNPKRSRRFADEDFTLETQQALLDFSTAGRIRVCSECGKAFWSERALFGHMRCHPERQWRGVLPPERSLEQCAGGMARYRRKRALAALKFMGRSELVIENDAEKEEDRAAELEAAVMGSAENCLHMGETVSQARDMEDVDGQEAKGLQSKVGNKEPFFSGNITETNKFTPRWRTAGRRQSRRRLVSKAGNGETSSEEPALTSESLSAEHELETQDCLMLLAEAARKIEEGAKSENHELQLSTDEYVHGFSLKDLKNGLETHQLDEPHRPFDAGPGEYEDDTGEYEDEDTPLFARRERLHKDLVASSIGGKYECTTCKKSFNTHQALGGHRASHKKTKGCFARTSLSEISGEHLLAEDLELSYVREKDPLHSIHKKKKKRQQTQKSVFKGHACSICHRTFLTGQALGGHKRCHWAGEKPSETASVASTEKQPSLQSEEQCSKMAEGGIDLNMPAPIDEDDEVCYGSAELHSNNGESACKLAAEKKDVGTWRESSETKVTSILDWTLKGDTSSLLAPATKREIEARHRFNGIWGQHWPNNKGVSHAQLPQQVCAMQSLV